MKNIFILAGFLFVFSRAEAQPSAKRYVLIEHFTNSWCSVCAGKNPDFYKTYDLNAKDLHHISYHPSIPYEQCVFYQANKTENSNRAEYYGVTSGTPRIALNGELASPSTPLLPAAKLTSALGKTSPVAISVKETLGSGSFKVDIEVARLGAVAAGTYKLYAALVEQNIALTTPNGEKNHRDVFRKMLNGINGTEFLAGPAGGKTTVSFSTSSLEPAWKTDQLYAVVFIQNTATKEILNSATKFDPVSTGIFEKETFKTVNITPNPVNDIASAQIGEDQAERVELYSLNGQRVALEYAIDQSRVEFDVSALSPGVYLVKITGKKNVYTARMVKAAGM